MGKGHKDNHAARKKRGVVAFEKKAERRRGSYIGPWNVTFKCGFVEYIPNSRSNEVREVARRNHSCKKRDCIPIKFYRVL